MRYENFENRDELDVFMTEHKYIIMNISAAWCKPCKKIAEPMELFIRGLTCSSDFVFLKADYDIISDDSLFMEEYKVSKIPYFVFIEKGVMKDSYIGADMEVLARMISSFVADKNPPEKISFQEDF
jgi:thiol:disulfide interchange protein